MPELSGTPAYRQIADELRTKIRNGRLPAGAQLPSTSEMMRTYDVSSTVIKAALNQLRLEGLVIGQQGKGVFVRDVKGTPGQDASDEYTALTRQLAEFREQLKQLNDRVARLEGNGGRRRPPAPKRGR